MDDSIGYQWSELSGKKGIQLLLQTALIEWRKLARKEKGGNTRIDFPTKRSGICGIHVCLHLIYEL